MYLLRLQISFPFVLRQANKLVYAHQVFQVKVRITLFCREVITSNLPNSQLISNFFTPSVFASFVYLTVIDFLMQVSDDSADICISIISLTNYLDSMVCTLRIPGHYKCMHLHGYISRRSGVSRSVSKRTQAPVYDTLFIQRFPREWTLPEPFINVGYGRILVWMQTTGDKIMRSFKGIAHSSGLHLRGGGELSLWCGSQQFLYVWDTFIFLLKFATLFGFASALSDAIAFVAAYILLLTHLVFGCITVSSARATLACDNKNKIPMRCEIFTRFITMVGSLKYMLTRSLVKQNQFSRKLFLSYQSLWNRPKLFPQKARGCFNVACNHSWQQIVKLSFGEWFHLFIAIGHIVRMALSALIASSNRSRGGSLRFSFIRVNERLTLLFG